MNFSPNLVFLNRSFDKKRLKALLLWFRLNLSEGAALEAVEILQGLGFRSATQGAISLGLDDLKTPTSKNGRVFQAQLEVALAHHEHHRGNRTPVELFQHLVDTWHRTSQDLTTEVVQLFHSTERVNPVYMMAFSGARGNLSQVRQLVGMRGLMADPRGQIVGFPILSNFREGLTITEYFVSCYGARKGVVDTAIRTADAGYLTRRLADVSHHFVVRTTNCGTHRTICLRDIKEGQKTILPLASRLVGRVLGEHIPKIAFRNQEITPDLASKIASQCTSLQVRSPLSCSLRWGVCQLCYGWGLSEGRRVTLGEAVGIIAAQSIGEPGTQLTLRTFHTGGVFSGDLLNEIRAPYNGTVFFPSPLQGLLVRTPHGQIAFLTKISGKMILSFSEKNVEKENSVVNASSSGPILECVTSTFHDSRSVPFTEDSKLDIEEKLPPTLRRTHKVNSMANDAEKMSASSHLLQSSQAGAPKNLFSERAEKMSATLALVLAKRTQCTPSKMEEGNGGNTSPMLQLQASASSLAPKVHVWADPPKVGAHGVIPLREPKVSIRPRAEAMHRDLTAMHGVHVQKENKEFFLQPSTVIFVRQKEQVTANQLLAEFSSSTLQPISDQIEVTQQVLSESAGQVWFKEIEYGNRKGPGSGSLGTHFSSQKLGGVWVLAGKPRSEIILNDRQHLPVNCITPKRSEELQEFSLCFSPSKIRQLSSEAAITSTQNYLQQNRSDPSLYLPVRSEDMSATHAQGTRCTEGAKKMEEGAKMQVKKMSASSPEVWVPFASREGLRRCIQGWNLNAMHGVQNVYHDDHSLKYHYLLGYSQLIPFLFAEKRQITFLYLKQKRGVEVQKKGFVHVTSPMKRSVGVRAEMMSAPKVSWVEPSAAVPPTLALVTSSMLHVHRFLTEKSLQSHHYIPLSSNTNALLKGVKRGSKASWEGSFANTVYGWKTYKYCYQPTAAVFITSGLFNFDKADYLNRGATRNVGSTPCIASALKMQNLFLNKWQKKGVEKFSLLMDFQRPFLPAARLAKSTVISSELSATLGASQQPFQPNAIKNSRFLQTKESTVIKPEKESDQTFAEMSVAWWLQKEWKAAPGILLAEPFFSSKEHSEGQVFMLSSSFIQQKRATFTSNIASVLIGDVIRFFTGGVPTLRFIRDVTCDRSASNYRFENKNVDSTSSLVTSSMLHVWLRQQEWHLNAKPFKGVRFACTPSKMEEGACQRCNPVIKKLIQTLNLTRRQYSATNRGIFSPLKQNSTFGNFTELNCAHIDNGIFDPQFKGRSTEVSNLTWDRHLSFAKEQSGYQNQRCKQSQAGVKQFFVIPSTSLETKRRKADNGYNLCTSGCTIKSTPTLRLYKALTLNLFWQPLSLANYPNKILAKRWERSEIAPIRFTNRSLHKRYNKGSLRVEDVPVGNQKLRFVNQGKRKGQKKKVFVQKPIWLSIHISNNNLFHFLIRSFTRGVCNIKDANSYPFRSRSECIEETKKKSRQIKNKLEIIGKRKRVEKNNSSLDQHIVHTVNLPIVSFPYLIPSVDPKLIFTPVNINLKGCQSMRWTPTLRYIYNIRDIAKRRSAKRDRSGSKEQVKSAGRTYYHSKCGTPIQGELLPLIRQSFWQEKFFECSESLDSAVSYTEGSGLCIKDVKEWIKNVARQNLRISDIQFAVSLPIKIISNLQGRYTSAHLTLPQKNLVSFAPLTNKGTPLVKGNNLLNRRFKAKFLELHLNSARAEEIAFLSYAPIGANQSIGNLSGISPMFAYALHASHSGPILECIASALHDSRSVPTSLVKKRITSPIKRSVGVQKKRCTPCIASAHTCTFGASEEGDNIRDVTRANAKSLYPSPLGAKEVHEISHTCCYRLMQRIMEYPVERSIFNRWMTTRRKKCMSSAQIPFHKKAMIKETRETTSKQQVDFLPGRGAWVQPFDDKRDDTNALPIRNKVWIAEKKFTSFDGAIFLDWYAFPSRSWKFPSNSNSNSLLACNTCYISDVTSKEDAKQKLRQLRPSITRSAIKADSTQSVADLLLDYVKRDSDFFISSSTQLPQKGTKFSDILINIGDAHTRFYPAKRQKRTESFMFDGVVDVLPNEKEQNNRSNFRKVVESKITTTQCTFSAPDLPFSDQIPLKKKQSGRAEAIMHLRASLAHHRRWKKVHVPFLSESDQITFITNNGISLSNYQKHTTRITIWQLAKRRSASFGRLSVQGTEKRSRCTEGAKKMEEESAPSERELDFLTSFSSWKTKTKITNAKIYQAMQSFFLPIRVAEGNKKEHVKNHNVVHVTSPMLQLNTSYQPFTMNPSTPVKPTYTYLYPGQLVTYGEKIDQKMATTESGQVLYLDSQRATLRKAQTVLIYSQAIISVLSGEWIKKSTPLMALSYQKLVTGDIVQGLPKIEQFFEAPLLKDGTFWSDSLQAKLNLFFQEYRGKFPLAEAVRKGFSDIQRVLVEGVQRVYISQGVLIADKHLEVIVRQMTCKGRILYSGDTGFLRNELVALDKIESVNQVTYGQKALYHPQVRGITDASLESESFLSAASFQETTRVLSRDAVIGKTDLMRGLKERVIVGELIQAGTGLTNNSVYSFLLE